MNTTVLLVFVVVFSFALGRFISRLASRYVVLSGAEYLIVGLLIGPHVGLNLVGEAQLALLEPVVSLLLGLAGFLVGIRAKRALVDTEHGVIGFASALVTVALFAALFLPILDFIEPPGGPVPNFVVDSTLFSFGGYAFNIYFTSENLWLSLALGAAACVASATLVDGFKRYFGASGPITTLVESSAHMSQIVAILVLGFVLATVRATSHQNPLGLSIAEWEMAAVGGSVVCGLLFSLFLGHETGQSKVFLATVGLVTFAAGAGSALSISPLFVNLITGLTVAFTSSHSGRLHKELDRLQHPLFVLLMIFAGALWSHPQDPTLWGLPLAYAAIRYLVRRFSTRATAMAAGDDSLRVPKLGDGLMGQGTLAIAIAVEFSLRFTHHSSLVLTIVLFGTLLTDLWSRGALRSLLATAGELDAKTSEGVQP